MERGKQIKQVDEWYRQFEASAFSYMSILSACCHCFTKKYPDSGNINVCLSALKLKITLRAVLILFYSLVKGSK